MAYTRRIVVVCGYGCNLDSPLRPYLDKVVAWAKANKPDFIILCGGATQQVSFPNETEASVMERFLYERLDSFAAEHNWHPGWWLEGTSYTSYENIRDAARVIADLKNRPWNGFREPKDEITIFCEATRALKVAILARHFMGFPPERGEPMIRIETDSWELMHPSLELLGTFKEWLAIRFPMFNTFQSRSRRKKSLLR